MGFGARRLRKLINEGFEAVRYARKLEKLAADRFIEEKMAALPKEVGDETWTAESIRHWRGANYRKTPIPCSVLNKFVCVCLEEAKGLLGAQWADGVFDANDMDREDMFPLLLKLLNTMEQVQPSPGVESGTSAVLSPLQRPARPQHFVGRERELETLLKALRPGKVIAICGPGGIGKSALAAEVAWRLDALHSFPKQFPGGVIYYDFYNRPKVEVALEHIVRSYGAEPLPTPKSAAQQVLSGRPALLVLDGTEVADDLAEILSVAGDCGVLLTTRRRLDAASNRLDLKKLPVDRAMELLRSWTGQATDEGSVRKICELLDGLPLAVILAGRYIDATQENVANYLDWLEQERLAALHIGEHQRESVPILLHRSLTQVSEQARQMLLAIGTLAPTPFTSETIAAAFEVIATDARAALNELTVYGILQRVSDRYQVSHMLIHAYAQQYYPPTTTVVRRLTAYFINLACSQIGRDVEGLACLDPEREHVMAMIGECADRGEWQLVHKLAGAIDEYLDLRGHRTEEIAALEAGLAAARELGDRKTQADFLNALGNVYQKTGRIEEGMQCQLKCVELIGEIGDRRGYAIGLHDLGNHYYAIREPFLALKHYEQALGLARDLNDERLIGSCQGHIGQALQMCGEPEKAIESLLQGLASARRFGIRSEENVFLGGLGLAYLDLQQPEQAMAYHQQALEMARELGDRWAEGMDLGNLGIAYAYQQQFESAISCLQQALNIARQVNDPINLIHWLVHLAHVYVVAGQREKARICLVEALPLAEKFSPQGAVFIRQKLEQLSGQSEDG